MPFKTGFSRIGEKIGWKSADRGRPPTTPAPTPTSTSGPHPHAPAAAEPEPQEPSPTIAAALRPGPCNAQPPLQATPDTAIPSSLRGRLWTQAYEAVRKDNSRLVDDYETLLRRVLGGGSDPADRRQMDELVREGLEKTKKEAAAKQKIEEGMNIVSSISNLVGTAVKHAPEAAAAWGGVCLLLQVLENPIKEASANRDGMTYVVSRMDWYWHLSSLLLDRDNTSGLQHELEKRIATLYKKLLSYQIESVCSYYQNRGFAFLRDVVKLDDWTGTVQSLKDAEVSVQRDIDTHTAQEMRMSLNKVAEEAEHRRTQLGQIHQTLQDFISMQKDIHRDDAEAACRKDLRVVDPQDDMQRIENDKDKLLNNAYRWILDTPEYTSFTNWDGHGPGHPQRRLLWIKGHAGTGKTMLMIGIIRELSYQPLASARALTYFFCQGTDMTLNNATAVLRSLIWLLLLQQPCLVSHLLQKHKESGANLFSDRNAFYALSKAFQDMLKDPRLQPVYLAIDALDECAQGRSDLIHLISTSLTLSQKVKWLLSSRPEVDVLVKLRQCDSPDLLTQDALVELHTENLESPVNAYIEHKLSILKERDGYDEDVLATISTVIYERAKNTFLWVALVFKRLHSLEGWYAVDAINEFPPGLSELYGYLMTRIENGQMSDPEYCKSVLVATSLAYRPLSLSELAIVAALPSKIKPQNIVDKCGSFLTLSGETVSLIHQSAKDYLEKNYESRLHPAGPAQGHADIGRRSIDAMSSYLEKNMYNLDFDSDPKDTTTPDPDPLAPVRYSCVFWADHLCSESPQCRRVLIDDGPVLGFLNKRFLCWLESLSLLRKLSDGVLSIRKLLHVVQSQLETSPRLTKLLEDAEKFVLSHGSIIERVPLQTYGSALVFSPTKSKVRNGHWKERLSFIKAVTGITDYWGAHRQTLEGHSGSVSAVAFSPNGKTLASTSGDYTIWLWDATIGVHRQTLKGHSRWVNAMAFSPDGKTLASASDDETIRLWDATTGVHRQTLEGHSYSVSAVAFLPNGKMLASASGDNTIRLWDATTGVHQQTLKGHGDWVRAMAFSPDSKTLASASDDETIRLWDATTGVHWQTLKGHSDWVNAIAFSPDNKTLESASSDKIRIWDATVSGHSDRVNAVAFSEDGQYLETNRGLLSINSNPDASNTAENKKPAAGGAYFVSGEWIARDGKNLLWLPPSYRATCVAAYESVLVLGHATGRMTFLYF